LSESLSGLLKTPEHIYINRGFVPDTPDADPESRHTYSINYGSHLLEKMVNAACVQVPLLACLSDLEEYYAGLKNVMLQMVSSHMRTPIIRNISCIKS